MCGGAGDAVLRGVVVVVLVMLVEVDMGLVLRWPRLGADKSNNVLFDSTFVLLTCTLKAKFTEILPSQQFHPRNGFSNPSRRIRLNLINGIIPDFNKEKEKVSVNDIFGLKKPFNVLEIKQATDEC